MKIKSLVDKIVVINLDKRKDRLQNCLKQSQKYDFDFTKIEAIDGDLLTEVGMLRHGEYALILSYIKALDYLIKNNFSTAIIFEDDFQFYDNVETRLDEMTYIPNDWDLIYLGANHYSLGAGRIPAININKYIIQIRSSFAAHAIMMKIHMYQIIRDLLATMMYPVDVAYSKLQSNYNCYGFKTNICKQYDSYSNIINYNPKYNEHGVFD